MDKKLNTKDILEQQIKTEEQLAEARAVKRTSEFEKELTEYARDCLKEFVETIPQIKSLREEETKLFVVEGINKKTLFHKATFVGKEITAYEFARNSNYATDYDGLSAKLEGGYGELNGCCYSMRKVFIDLKCEFYCQLESDEQKRHIAISDKYIRLSPKDTLEIFLFSLNPVTGLGGHCKGESWFFNSTDEEAIKRQVDNWKKAIKIGLEKRLQGRLLLNDSSGVCWAKKVGKDILTIEGRAKDSK